MLKIEKVYVVPGAGRKVPLPLPGGGFVPAAGKSLPRATRIERLITSGDLVVTDPPTSAAPAATEVPAAGDASVPGTAAVKVKG